MLTNGYYLAFNTDQGKVLPILLKEDQLGVQNVWGLSFYEGTVAYRTLGIPFEPWWERPGNDHAALYRAMIGEHLEVRPPRVAPPQAESLVIDLDRAMARVSRVRDVLYSRAEPHTCDGCDRVHYEDRNAWQDVLGLDGALNRMQKARHHLTKAGS